MVTEKPRIVIIGAGMSGLAAANKLYTSTISDQLFELYVVEGGSRIGGRIYSTEFSGDLIELGATWIHGIEGSPIYTIAKEKGLLHSEQPWEYMDGDPEEPDTIAEGGHELDLSIVKPISSLFKNLKGFIRGEAIDEDGRKHCISSCENGSVGSFLRKGLEAYWGVMKDKKSDKRVGNWSRQSLEEAIFAMHEGTYRISTSADDLQTLDYHAEREYKMFPGEEITIAGGYSRVIEYLASVLPEGMIQLGRKVDKIEWQLETGRDSSRPVKLHFSDGSTLQADHVIVTVSLGVLKHAICEGCEMFSPPLPGYKTRPILKLGYGVVNKVFSQLPEYSHDQEFKFPFMQMVFHTPDSDLRNPKIPQWMRRASWWYPIYGNSRVVLSWFTGKDAIEIESLTEEEIIKGFYETASDLLSSKLQNGKQLKFGKVLRSKWGSDPLFLGSYSYVAVGSSVEDIDAMSEPLPRDSDGNSAQKLQILFAGEATHATLYSTTHGAYFSGSREADRLLNHYKANGL